MHSKSKLILLIVPCVCLTNAFADVSEDRLNTYKGNKLIPQEVEIATINSVASESAGVAVFNPSDLSWRSYNNAQSAVLSKYMDWTKSDFQKFFADSSNKEYFKEARDFLSQVGNNHLDGATIADADALGILQSQLNSNIKGEYFPCEGLDFTGKDLTYWDLSKFSGLTAAQLLSAYRYDYTILPNIDFSNTDITGKNFYYVDMSKCTGLTGEQVLSAGIIIGAQLPSVDFSGTTFSGKNISYTDLSSCTGLTASQIFSAYNFTYTKLPSIDLSGTSFVGKNIAGVDFTNCTGLTASQLKSASSGYSSCNITSTQYEAIRNELSSGSSIFVDGVKTTVSPK